jgi:hypothetical protein
MRYLHMSLGSADIVGGGQPEAAWEFLGENGEAFSNVASGVSSLVTAVAVIIGGIWAYRKFIQGRTFKPRLSAEMCAQWHVLPGVGHVLRVGIGVTNIGASKLILTPCGLRISFPAARQTSAAHRRTDKWWADVRWENVPLLEGATPPRGRQTRRPQNRPARTQKTLGNQRPRSAMPFCRPIRCPRPHQPVPEMGRDGCQTRAEQPAAVE